MAGRPAKKVRGKKAATKTVKRTTKKTVKSPSSALNTAMAHVKISLVEVLDAFKRKQEARLAALDEFIDGPKKGKALSKSCGEKLAKKLAALKVKPKKGRAKDLVKIEKLLEELMDCMPKGS